jgi:hypothetical protein
MASRPSRSLLPSRRRRALVSRDEARSSSSSNLRPLPPMINIPSIAASPLPQSGNPRRMDIPAGFMPAFPRYTLLVLCTLYHRTLGFINIHANYLATCLVGATKQSSTLPRGALAKAKRALLPVFLATRRPLFARFFHAAAPWSPPCLARLPGMWRTSGCRPLFFLSD